MSLTPYKLASLKDKLEAIEAERKLEIKEETAEVVEPAEDKPRKTRKK